MHANPFAQRFLIWSSMLTLTIFGLSFAFLMGFLPPPSANLTSAEVLNLYTTNNLKFRIGVVVCILTAGFFIPWSLAVSVQMERFETGIPIWSKLQFMSGAIGSLLFVLPALLWGLAAFSVERNPEITTLAHDLGFLIFVTTTSFFPFQAIPIIAVGLSRKPKHVEARTAFPRWMGFIMLWYLICSEAGVMAQMFKIGPFSWNGLFAFWIPAAGFSAWFPLICYMMLRAVRLDEQDAKAGATLTQKEPS